MSDFSAENDDVDDTLWHEENGVPRLGDPFIQQYLNGRDALVEQEKKQRSDRHFRENLSPTAQEACAIVDQIRFEEQQTIWTPDLEESLAEKFPERDVYPGMMFSLAKDRIEQSTLWKIVRKMPKGALLHCHFEAMVEAEWILEQAFKVKGMGIRSEKSLEGPDARVTASFGFAVEAEGLAEASAKNEGGISIWSDAYKPGTLEPIEAAADAFPHGGRVGFLAWVTSRCSITPEESIAHHGGVNQVWRKFLNTFSILRTLIYVDGVIDKYVRRLCQQLHDDGILWADVRGVFPADPAFFESFERVVDEYKNSSEGHGFWGMRIIWTCVRAFDKRAVIESMKNCIKIKKLFPNLIAGFDFVGQEDTGRPLQDLIPEIFWFKKRCMEEGNLQIPFFFHAGETLGDGTPTDENLFDAVLLNTRRIGHGFSLFKHPLLIDMIKEKKILVESCPVSNEVLRLTSSISAHPLPALLARGVPVSLCNDDPAILGHSTTGVSHDFFQALQGWENLGLAGLGSLAENSVRWAAFEDGKSQKEWLLGVKLGAAGDGVRAVRIREWQRAWEAFCEWVVSEFGSDEDFEGEDDDDGNDGGGGDDGGGGGGAGGARDGDDLEGQDLLVEDEAVRASK